MLISQHFPRQLVLGFFFLIMIQSNRRCSFFFIENLTIDTNHTIVSKRVLIKDIEFAEKVEHSPPRPHKPFQLATFFSLCFFSLKISVGCFHGHLQIGCESTSPDHVVDIVKFLIILR